MTTPLASDRVEATRAAIRQELATPGVRLLVRTYFDTNSGFAGLLFDGAGKLLTNNPYDRFVAEDILATSLLDVPVGPRAVAALLGGSYDKDLKGISADVSLWDAEGELLAATDSLWQRLTNLEGVGPVIAGKLLARKRPHLVPVIDSVILKALPIAGDAWALLRAALADSATRAHIEKVRAEVPAAISTLRILDVAIWMLHSQSGRAASARLRMGKAGPGPVLS